MKTALHDQPAFSEMFVSYLLTRNSRIEEDLIDQLFNSSERRLARMLLLLSHFGKEGTPQLITPNISQETLAEMIGTTRSRVSFFMNKFRKLGLITITDISRSTVRCWTLSCMTSLNSRRMSGTRRWSAGSRISHQFESFPDARTGVALMQR